MIAAPTLEKKSCVKCGSTDRNKNGRCRPCGRAASNRWNKANRPQVYASQAAQRRKDPLSAVTRSKRAKLRRHGLTIEKYEEMLAAQGGVCAICRQPEKDIEARTGKVKALAVDHCHKTGRIRGLLCRACNHLLGLAQDDVELLATAYNYLVTP
jgi:hypothetical protein